MPPRRFPAGLSAPSVGSSLAAPPRSSSSFRIPPTAKTIAVGAAAGAAVLGVGYMLLRGRAKADDRGAHVVVKPIEQPPYLQAENARGEYGRKRRRKKRRHKRRRDAHVRGEYGWGDDG